jgi:hypothetical protein
MHSSELPKEELYILCGIRKAATQHNNYAFLLKTYFDLSAADKYLVEVFNY